MSAVASTSSTVSAIDPITAFDIGGLAAQRNRLAQLRQQLAEAGAAPASRGDASRVEALARRKAEVEARIEALRQEAAKARQGASADADAEAAAPALGAHVDEFA